MTADMNAAFAQQQATKTDATPPGEVKPFWQEIDDAHIGQRVLLFYGQSGVGKTRLAGQLPDPLFLSCDPGVLGGAESAKAFGIKHLKIKSYSHFMSVYPQIVQGAKAGQFKTVVVDSISYFGQLTMRAILETVGREIPRFEEWNLNATRMRKVISMISDLPCHICFIAVDDKTKDETTGKIFGGPNLPGKLSIELPQACDTVLRLMTKTGYNQQGELEVKYVFRSVPDDVWFAKDRTNLLPKEGESNWEAIAPLFENPTTNEEKE